MDNPHKGIVFDAYYTDSLLRTLGGRSRDFRIMSTRKALPRGEVLTNLLLFGHAHLSYPYWLDSPDLPRLDTLEREGLVSWIPSDYYEQSLDFIRSYTRCLDGFFQWHYLDRTLSLDAALDSYGGVKERRWLNETRRTFRGIEEQLEMLSFYIDQLQLFEPLIASGLWHARLGPQCADWLFRRPIFWPSGPIEWSSSPEQDLLSPVFFSLLHNAVEDKSFSRHAHKAIDSGDLGMAVEELFYDPDPKKAVGILKAEAAVLDTMLSMLTIESFAGDTKNPVKVHALHTELPSAKSPIIQGSYLYQLVQVQFSHLRYPVIDTLDDILRLRDDPNLANYREVIFLYGRNLQEALENERFEILKKFRRDIEKTLGDISRAHKWNTYLDLTFYLSIPLAIVGVLTGLPLSDILTIPVGGAAKLASVRRKRKTGWLMFGCPKANILRGNVGARRRRS